MFRKYDKIFRLGKEETDWILNGTCYIEEKIDWANLSIWMEEWKICIWSRNLVVCDKENRLDWFNWAVEYVLQHEWIRELLQKMPELRLYWEWLVPHTVSYYPENYKHFYMFDIEHDWWLIEPDKALEIADKYNIRCPKLLWILENPTQEQLLEYVWNSVLWEIWEWIVIKNYWFVNKFWNYCYAKIVWDVFKETKYEKNIWICNDTVEKEIATKFNTMARFNKIIYKIEQEKWMEKINNKDIPKILWYMEYDILSEEIMIIKKYWIVNFKLLQKEIMNITKQYLKEINLL
jgi:hypothetical protein